MGDLYSSDNCCLNISNHFTYDSSQGSPGFACLDSIVFSHIHAYPGSPVFDPKESNHETSEARIYNRDVHMPPTRALSNSSFYYPLPSELIRGYQCIIGLAQQKSSALSGQHPTGPDNFLCGYHINVSLSDRVWPNE
ncbi:Uncharacterized protein HZ326_5871 [Fusarium oxysporum f. sp. albedinis]|nr:Uncharacterized protein HZ326_5871 [Fusarium oxysporum f. sp. albedinis]